MQTLPGLNFKASRYILIAVVIFLGASLTGCRKDFTDQLQAPRSPVARTDKPNIILIFTDDYGYELPHYTGGESYQTPNLDWMAANGMQLSQMMSHPDGSPSRMAMFTGKYNFRNYIRWGLLPTNEKTTGNMMEDAGYATCFVGKWQGDGGDTSIHNHGFQNYSVFLPYAGDQRVRRYKNPLIYQDGGYLPDDVVAGKYSEDMYVDYLENFIEDNVDKPFFAIYAPVLVAQPWVPTPDDPEFDRWDPKKDTKKDDIKFFASMVRYNDKKVGQIIDKVRKLGLQNNTIIMFVGESGTDSRVTSIFNGRTIQGHKTETIKWGTRQPFVAYWPGVISPGTIDSSLVDFTDFLPTFADIANISVPVNYGKIDGMTFFDNLKQTSGPQRNWVFCDWNNEPWDDDVKPAERFIYEHTYKLYDTSGVRANNFYNMEEDPDETHPLPDNQLTPYEAALKAEYKTLLRSMRK